MQGQNKEDLTLLYDSFIINYFGFLSLYALDNTGYIRIYANNERDVQLEQINKNNHSEAFFLKEAFDSGILKSYIARDMARILYKIKSDRNSEYQVDEEETRNNISGILYWNSKTSYRVREILYKFHSGDITIQEISYLIWRLSMLKSYKPLCYDIVEIIKKGHYYDKFEDNKYFQI
ncbi:MAG: hypothetical protein PHC28_15215 [Flavobacterium sp.]|uniref:hypothetical protein n=1 Tax=Flavobacterium sp. TaxID=239 RepID=UPI002620A5EE|nr:hypothetical protein [Flavobacterium sp.]MDD5151804.1 hypothetical protein [Flavobacterium sp.]